MLANVATFAVAKRDSSMDECEDSFWVSPNASGEVERESLRVVVTDGATESLLAGPWAAKLAASFGIAAGPTKSKSGFVSAYQTAVTDWGEELARYRSDREARDAPIQWFEEPGLAKGAYSTIIVVDFFEDSPSSASKWRAMAIGDSCLFQVRNERLHACFPIQDEAAFSYHPPLLSSRGTDSSVVARHLVKISGTWQQDDSFYVVTDALAAWFLRSVEAGDKPWSPLRDLDTVDFLVDFGTWVNARRDEGSLRDDDTTLVRIDLY